MKTENFDNQELIDAMSKAVGDFARRSGAQVEEKPVFKGKKYIYAYSVTVRFDSFSVEFFIRLTAALCCRRVCLKCVSGSIRFMNAIFIYTILCIC